MLDYFSLTLVFEICPVFENKFWNLLQIRPANCLVTLRKQQHFHGRTRMAIERVMMNLCDGNPGSLSVCREIADKTDKPLGTFTAMKVFKVRGPLIWVAYTHCDKDVHKLVKRLIEQDRALFESVNAEREKEGMPERCGTPF